MPRPKPQPPPRKPDRSDKGITDDDLLDVNPGGTGGGDGGGGSPRTDQSDGPAEGVIPAIVSSVAVALAGVVSGYVAYYKKKLCFKPSAGHGDTEMANQAEPPVQQTLLER